ncbi:hypothetical protein B0A48_05654 [Cryoendolithus antarcticus]|uniref:Heterokaryon incompatibility domain-containing protein n=1 Tax=Cryoendolithus antarcticus TaxID=1507870 RepID=A0A1V8TBV9_9PEZI|nr:hypothetical protein B0A48_05654 [Cryoendolithus antarcticus]
MEPCFTRRFTHDPLPDPKTHIRLLGILKSALDGTHTCRLAPYAIAEAPPYTAISYAWGIPMNSVDIVVNGARMTIRSNCAYVLGQASWHNEDYYWIDAICINQSDDHEKAAQVQTMGEVYRNAQDVQACVGPHVEAENSVKLCAYLREHETTLRKFAEGIEPGLGVARFSVLINAAEEAELKRQAIYMSQHMLGLQEPILWALLAILKRPYFSRAWVAQELHMAAKPTLYCGTDTCDFAALTGLLLHGSHSDSYWDNTDRARMLKGQSWQLFGVPTGQLPEPLQLRELIQSTQSTSRNAGSSKRTFCMNHLQLPPPLNTRPIRSLALRRFAIKLAKYVSVPATACKSRDEPLSMQTLILETAYLQCTDPRDKIFALLSMLRPEIAREIHVDYRKTAFELMTSLIPLAIPENVQEVFITRRKELQQAFCKFPPY